jgi:NTE family protein
MGSRINGNGQGLREGVRMSDVRWMIGTLCGVLLYSALLPPVVAAESQAGQAKRPRIGLVLSGGGARGAAHVGVLKFLEEQHIPIDYIAGTSMGSIIGGLYASGMTPDEIEHALKSIDWEHIFSDAPPREDRSFRRKSDDRLYLVKNKPGFNNGEVEFPAGAIQGQKFDLALRQLTLPVSTVTDFDKLHIPFRAVASDIVTGKAVVIGKGDLAMAMRASMAVPGAFAPAKIDGHLLVDGGITNNMPINVVREMGADIVIAVDISTPYLPADKIKNLFNITAQLTSIMTRSNADAQIATLTGRDVLIVPNLGNITSGDFTRAGEAIPIGYKAAEAQRDHLAQLSLPQTEYNAQLAAHNPRPDSTPPIVHFIRIENHSKVADGMIRDRLHIKEGQPLDRAQLEADIGDIYGLELFQNVRYDVVEENGQTGVVVSADERAWGPNYLQFGLALTSDSRGESSFNLGMAYHRTAINPLGGELRAAVQFGAEPFIGGEWYQPLDTLSRYFITPKLSYGVQHINVYNGTGENRLADYSVHVMEADLVAGREFSVYGDGRIGYRYRTGTIDQDVGTPALPEGNFDTGLAYARLSVDRLDDYEWPSKGMRGYVEYDTARRSLASDADFDQASGRIAQFATFGSNTFGFYGQVKSTVSGVAPVQDRFRLGGFLNLSGYDENSLSGQQLASVAVMAYRRYKPLPILSWYIGGSLEYGGVWENRDDIGSNGIAAGSLFIGADTPIGPLYLGYGHAEQGFNSVFFYLGRPFN